MDLVIADSCLPQVRILWNDGAGAFEEADDIATFDPVRNVLARDLDGDGDADVVAIESYVETHVLVYSNQAGTFTLSQRLLVDVNSSRPDLGDLALDGRAELVLCLRTNSSNSEHGFLVFPNSTGIFGTPTLHSIGGSIPMTDTEIADMNGDGALDVVGHSNGAMYSWLNDGQGALVLGGGDGYPGITRMFAANIDEDGFADRVLLRFSTRDVVVFLTTQPEIFTLATYSEFPNEVRAADLDGDGLLDLRIAAGELHDYVRIPGGAFLAAGSHSVPAGSARFASADFDGDGAIDAAAVSPLVDSLALVFASGESYTPAQRIAAGFAMDQDFADLDADGDLDVVVATDTHIGGQIRVLRNVAGILGGIEPVANELSAGGRFALGDVDRDGDVDIVSGASNQNELRVYTNDGTAQFTRTNTLPLAREVLSMQLALIDGDGALDLMTIETSSPMHVPGQLAVHRRGDGAGAFELITHHAMGELCDRLVLGDYTGYGDTDVLLVDATSPERDGVLILENASTCSTGDVLCAGDGTATACPCGNTGASGRGCANSFESEGAALVGTGRARVTSDSLTLTASGFPPTTLAHFLQSDVPENGGAGVAFGDGLLCVGGTIRRLAVRQASLGAANLGAGTAQPVSLSQLGALPTLGGARIYQARYRKVAAFCTPATFNTTNALRVVWGD